MEFDEYLNKTWIIVTVNTVTGGICVFEDGIIVSSWSKIDEPHLVFGRVFSSGGGWYKLEVLMEKPNFGLVLFRVVEAENSKFPVFDLKRGVNLARGDKLHGLFHTDKKPFSSCFGYSARPFRCLIDDVPSIESTTTLAETGDSRTEVLNYPISYLRAKHVLMIDSIDKNDEDVHLDNCEDTYGIDDSEGGHDGKDNHENDEDRPEDMDATDDGDGVEDGKDIDESDYSYSDDDNISDTNIDCEYPIHFLHPDIPLIQINGMSAESYSRGCPIFDMKNNFIGIYFFAREGCQYAIPLTFLDIFVDKLTPFFKKQINNPECSDQRSPKSQNVDFATDAPATQSDVPQSRAHGPKKCQSDASDQPLSGPSCGNSSDVSAFSGLLDVNCAPFFDAKLDDTTRNCAAGCKRKERVLFQGNMASVGKTAWEKAKVRCPIVHEL